MQGRQSIDTHSIVGQKLQDMKDNESSLTRSGYFTLDRLDRC